MWIYRYKCIKNFFFHLWRKNYNSTYFELMSIFSGFLRGDRRFALFAVRIDVEQNGRLQFHSMIIHFLMSCKSFR